MNARTDSRGDSDSCRRYRKRGQNDSGSLKDFSSRSGYRRPVSAHAALPVPDSDANGGLRHFQGHAAMNEFSRWARMITLLDASPETGRAMPPSLRDANGAGYRRRNTAPVPSSGSTRRRATVVAAERQTGSAVLLSWSDATRFRYDEQRWISAKSRKRSCCALSGRSIRIGDAVYKPQCRGEKLPANCADMILATEIDSLILRFNRQR
ncbi:DUF3331 domain-containing protein [Burkholderia stagnalis]